MKRRFSYSMMIPAFVGALSCGSLSGCGVEGVDSVQQAVVETKAATIGQADFDSYTNAVKLKDCKFNIAAGTATFTPSNELAGVLYGDPNGAAHKSTFAVPPITASGATITISTLDADFANTGLSLSGSNANVKLAFKGLLKINVTLPVIGTVKPDIEIKPSNLTTSLTYDKATDRAKVASVKANFTLQTKNCGFLGFCNGIVDSFLKSNLPAVETALKDALTKALDDQDVSDGLKEGLVIMYNAKDPKTPAWTLVANTLELSTGAFRFTVER